tara:strand:- start:1773 stop:2447 length:675 start_codon:yes stop_codon:yes gene_type:complete
MSDSPAGYNPFKMKAGKASGYDNSPMKKNYGQFGVGTSEMPTKPTPNKFFGGTMGQILGGGGSGGFKGIMEKIKAQKAAKAASGAAGAEGDAAGMAADPEMATAEASGAEAAEAGGGASGEVPVHGMEAHKKSAKHKMLGKMKTMDFMGGMFSDVRLKEKIEKTGISPSGIPIYEFNYIGSNNRYSGAMAQDLLEINPNAVMMDTSGYYKVNYNNIDVDMHQIN